MNGLTNQEFAQRLVHLKYHATPGDDNFQFLERQFADLQTRVKEFEEQQKSAWAKFAAVQNHDDFTRQLEETLAQLQTVTRALKSQDAREQAAGQRCDVPYEQSRCDWPDTVAEEVLSLRQQLKTARAERDQLLKASQDETASHVVSNVRYESRLADLERQVRERDAVDALPSPDGKVADLMRRNRTLRDEKKQLKADVTRLQLYLEKIKGQAHGGAMLGGNDSNRACLKIDVLATQALAGAPHERPRNCPTCDSAAQHLHPAIQHEGEVQLCNDPWHAPAEQTSEEKIAALEHS